MSAGDSPLHLRRLAARVSQSYLEAVARTIRTSEAVCVCTLNGVRQVLQDQIGFTRPLPRIKTSTEGLQTLSAWAVFRNDPLQRDLRAVITASLNTTLAPEQLAFEDKVDKLIHANVANGPFNVCARIAEPLAHVLLSEICGLPLERGATSCSKQSVLIDLAERLSDPPLPVEQALAMFHKAALESTAFLNALKFSDTLVPPLDRQLIAHNIGMLIFSASLDHSRLHSLTSFWPWALHRKAV